MRVAVDDRRATPAFLHPTPHPRQHCLRRDRSRVSEAVAPPGVCLRSGEGGGDSADGRSAACVLLALLGSGPCSIHFCDTKQQEGQGFCEFDRGDDEDDKRKDRAERSGKGT